MFKVGGFDEKLKVAEDFDLCEKLNKLGDIILDARIHTVHLRESRTIAELFFRELWRGKNSLTHWKASGFSLYEAPSVLLPGAFLFTLSAGIITLFFNWRFSIILILLACLPSIVVLARIRDSVSQFREALFVLVLSSTYFAARGIALLKELFYLKK